MAAAAAAAEALAVITASRQSRTNNNPPCSRPGLTSRSDCVQAESRYLQLLLVLITSSISVSCALCHVYLNCAINVFLQCSFLNSMPIVFMVDAGALSDLRLHSLFLHVMCAGLLKFHRSKF